jgi:hypothetical protein
MKRKERNGKERQARKGMEWHEGKERHGMAWKGMKGMTRQGMAWHGMTRQGME